MYGTTGVTPSSCASSTSGPSPSGSPASAPGTPRWRSWGSLVSSCYILHYIMSIESLCFFPRGSTGSASVESRFEIKHGTWTLMFRHSCELWADRTARTGSPDISGYHARTASHSHYHPRGRQTYSESRRGVGWNRLASIVLTDHRSISRSVGQTHLNVSLINLVINAEKS